MKIHESNTYRKDLSWPYFNNEHQGFKRKQMKDEQSNISVLVAYLIFPSSSYDHRPRNDNIIARLYRRFIEIHNNFRRKKPHRTNQSFNFQRGSFINRDNARAPIQFRRERQPKNLKRWFFFKNRPIHFQITYTSVIRLFKQTKLSFSALKSTSHFLLQSTVSRR